MTNARNDEKLATILDQNGLEGVGLYWMILEIIAQHMDKTDRCYAEYPARMWAKYCGISAKKFLKLAEILAELQLLCVHVSEKSIKIECSNLLKFRDEYTSKVRRVSGQAPVQCPDQDTDTEADTETKIQKQTQKRKASTPPDYSIYDAQFIEDIAKWLGPSHYPGNVLDHGHPQAYIEHMKDRAIKERKGNPAKWLITCMTTTGQAEIDQWRSKVDPAEPEYNEVQIADFLKIHGKDWRRILKESRQQL